MNYAFSCAGLGCCRCPDALTRCRGTWVTCVRAMGHGTPDNMNWAGLLQVSESKAMRGFSILMVSNYCLCVSD